MPTPYKLTIQMDDATATKLGSLGYQLYAFKGAKVSGKATPVVWFTTGNYSKTTDIDWTENYGAYTSTVTIAANAQIKASASYPMDLGQRLTVDNDKGTGTVTADPSVADTEIQIFNNTQQEFTCGMTVEVGGKQSPICAYDSLGKNVAQIAPIEKVLIYFATEQKNTGTVIIQNTGPGLVIDLTANPSRTVTYDITKNWGGNTEAWVKQVNTLDNIAPLIFS